MTELTQSRLKELLNYNPDTGEFSWLVAAGRVMRGAKAGHLHSGGYRHIQIDGKVYRAHRLVWLYMTGAWPSDQIDHRNVVRDDNRWDNLREATNAENCQNANLYKNNRSGFMGVAWESRRQKWKAAIMVAGRHKHLGYFTTPEAAHAAYLAAKSILHTFQPTIQQAGVTSFPP